VSLDWAVGAVVIAGAFFVLGLAGFATASSRWRSCRRHVARRRDRVADRLHGPRDDRHLRPLRADFDPAGSPLLLGSVLGTPLACGCSPRCPRAR